MNFYFLFIIIHFCFAKEKKSIINCDESELVSNALTYYLKELKVDSIYILRTAGINPNIVISIPNVKFINRIEDVQKSKRGVNVIKVLPIEKENGFVKVILNYIHQIQEEEFIRMEIIEGEIFYYKQMKRKDKCKLFKREVLRR